ncbi:transcriptional regulator [Curvivirga sp.]|uniref:transcriptional regulator n=1 Tax=Curvivirga sp. TaxID=2856848 RepID=UPI003B5C3203
MPPYPKLDPIFHQPVRTRIAISLVMEPRSFKQLKALLNITDGNLDAHLKKLSNEGYLHSQMITDDGRPYTLYQLSDSGRRAFNDYEKALRLWLSHLQETDNS